MAKTKLNKDYFAFVRGLITEAGPLTFPDNASLDEANFILNRDGSRQRRLGVDYESGYTKSANIILSEIDGLAIAVYPWRTVANSPSTNFLVIQIGTTIYFHKYDVSAISSNAKSFTTDLTTYQVDAAHTNFGVNPIQVVSGEGRLFIVSEDTEPFMVEYTSSSDTITETQLNLQIRDFIGVDDTLAVDNRPATLSTLHQYNLYNQGWDSAKNTATFTQLSKYPSNADIWTTARNTSDAYDATKLDNYSFGNTPAPKGKYVLNAFSKDRNTVSGLSGLTTVTENKRPRTIEFFAGRIWYAGVLTTSAENSPGSIYFSQVIGSSFDITNEVSNCYQEADPTSEEISDLVDTDGGLIPIPESGNIYKLEAVRNNLIVFAENGVWQISGSSDSGFTATGYFVNKITDVGVVNAEAIISVEGTVFYWSDGGIYVLKPDDISGNLVATNITINSIQTLYNSIGSDAKLSCKGVYDTEDKKIYWMYNNDSDFDGATNRYKYTKLLILDLALNAFSVFTISNLSTLSPFIIGGVKTLGLNTTEVQQNVISSSSLVESSGVQVTVATSTRTNATSQIKFLVAEPQSDTTNYKYTFAELRNTGFLDWVLSDATGIDYVSFLETGYEILDDAMRNKQAVWLFTYFNRTESGYIIDSNGNIDYENPSACLVQSKWDWSDSTASNKWGAQFQAYRLNRNFIPDDVTDTFDYGYPVIFTKNKFRGRGRSLHIKFQSQQGKDLQLLGWSIPFAGESEP